MAKSGGGADCDYIFKLVLIGDAGVGKTNLLLRFTRGEFLLGTQTTIGVEFAYRELTINGKKIKNQIWDTAGQERFTAVIPQVYRGSEGIIVVFDLTKPKTFTSVKNWMEEIHRHTEADLPIILIGNKSDLVNQRKVSQKEAIALAEELNVSYMETSALDASNVERAFTTLVTEIYQKKKVKSVEDLIKKPPIDDEHSHTISVVLGPIDDNVKPTESEKSGCCKTS